MFKSISDKEFDFNKIKYNELKEYLLQSKFSIGNNELYKNDWKSVSKTDYVTKSLTGNTHSTKNIEYLIPNRSTVKLKGEEDKKPYLTSFKRDYYKKPITDNKLNVELRKLIKNSKISVCILNYKL